MSRTAQPQICCNLLLYAKTIILCIETQVTSSDVVDTCAALGKSKRESDKCAENPIDDGTRHDSASRRQHENSPQTFLGSGGYTELIKDPLRNCGTILSLGRLEFPVVGVATGHVSAGWR